MTPVELLNLALLKIGQSKGITSTSDATREAWTGQQVYDHLLRTSLRTFPWPFATKYAALYATQGRVSWNTPLVQAWSATASYLVGDLVSVSGTLFWAKVTSTNQAPPNAAFWYTAATTPVVEANPDWDYAYRWPSDCLFARRFVIPEGLGRQFDINPVQFRPGRDNNGMLLYSDQTAAVLEYTTIDCEHLWVDDIWIEYFTWLLASALAPSMTRDKELVNLCTQMMNYWKEQAMVVASRESQQAKDGDALWILDRG
jgi:hypothetical protein